MLFLDMTTNTKWNGKKKVGIQWLIFFWESRDLIPVRLVGLGLGLEMIARRCGGGICIVEVLQIRASE